MTMRRISITTSPLLALAIVRAAQFYNRNPRG